MTDLHREQLETNIEEMRATIKHMDANIEHMRAENEKWRKESVRDWLRLLLYAAIAGAAVFAAGAGLGG